MLPRILLAAALLAAWVSCAWAQEPAPRSLAATQALSLAGGQGLPGGAAPAFSPLELIQPGAREHLAARFGPQGRPAAGRLIKALRQRPWPELWLFAPQGLPGPWWVERAALMGPAAPAPGAQARVGVLAWGTVPAERAVLLAGPAAAHAERLRRLGSAPLPAETKARLLAGRIAPGDSLWLVQLAWGRPQRSFMVNYLNDEQHYVYLTPQGPVLLRFKGGHLIPPLPAGGLAPVAKPTPRR